MIETLEALLAAAQKHGLALSPERPDLDQTGMDFLVLHARDAEGVPWVVRTPRRPDVLERARAEQRALELLRPRLPVTVPHFRVFDANVIAYPRLPGSPAGAMNVEEKRFDWRFDPLSPPKVFIDSLAGALVAMHAVAPDVAAQAGLRVQSPDEVRQDLAKMMDATRGPLGVSEAMWQRWQRWLADKSFWPEQSVLIHGDFHPGHMLIDDEHCLVGLLDWTEALVGDPAVDLAMVYGIFGKPALDALLASYQAAGGRLWPRIHDHIVERWGSFPVAAAAFAALSGNEAILEQGRAMLASFEATAEGASR